MSQFIKNYFVWITLILLIFVRYISSRPVYKNGDTVRISATVLTDPVIYTSSMSTSQYLRIENLKVYLPPFPQISYGDKIVVEGVVDNGKLDNPKIVEVGETKSFLSDFRNSIISFYQKTLPEPEAGVLSGIVMGAKGQIPNDFYEKVKNSGVSYIVSASGIKLAILISFLFGVSTLFLKRKKAIVFVILISILYIFVSGPSISIIRSGIMALFTFLGQLTGRIVNSWRILVLLRPLFYYPARRTSRHWLYSFICCHCLNNAFGKSNQK